MKKISQNVYLLSALIFAGIEITKASNIPVQAVPARILTQEQRARKLAQEKASENAARQIVRNFERLESLADTEGRKLSTLELAQRANLEALKAKMAQDLEAQTKDDEQAEITSAPAPTKKTLTPEQQRRRNERQKARRRKKNQSNLIRHQVEAEQVVQKKNDIRRIEEQSSAVAQQAKEEQAENIRKVAPEHAVTEVSLRKIVDKPLEVENRTFNPEDRPYAAEEIHSSRSHAYNESETYPTRRPSHRMPEVDETKAPRASEGIQPHTICTRNELAYFRNFMKRAEKLVSFGCMSSIEKALESPLYGLPFEELDSIVDSMTGEYLGIPFVYERNSKMVVANGTGDFEGQLVNFEESFSPDHEDSKTESENETDDEAAPYAYSASSEQTMPNQGTSSNSGWFERLRGSLIFYPLKNPFSE